MSQEIPPNNTPTPQDVWEHNLTFHSENVTPIGRTSGDYYLLFLPYKIEKFGWKTGEDLLLLELVEDDPNYIRGVRASAEYDAYTLISSKKAVYALRTQGSNRPRIGIPKMWADEFLNYGGDESLTVELNEVEGEPHIRIFDGEDAQKRKTQLVEDGYSVKDGPSRVVAPLGIAYSVKKFVLDKVTTRPETLELDVPSQVREDSVIPVSVEADLPELQKVMVQHRVQGEPGFTDIETASVSNQSGSDQLPRPFKLDASYDLSEDEGSIFQDDGPEIHEFRVRARYRNDETLNSEIQEVKPQ
jgi:hypothetical protein